MIHYEQNNNLQNLPSSSSNDLLLGINGADATHKRKRRPAGTPGS
ncbi:IDD16 [Arabidopsis thaliana]|uniref:IDD16 n=1 Tax=Arabidopsis thaliana TaxID=3702 RepID=A0A178WH81_ARATH|nr:IDD16 [Arabidopsis thaliana]